MSQLGTGLRPSDSARGRGALLQSVIVSTYNKPQHLRLVLEGLRHQTRADSNFEVIIADDGSTEETRHLIEEFRTEASFAIEHVWQEDLGFRAARIRNLGVQASQGSQIVFLDGDCIPFPEFLTVMADRYREDSIEAGDRLFLDREPSARLTVDDVASGRFRSILPRAQYTSLRWRSWKDRFYTTFRLKERPKVVTANLAVPRSGFLEINGLDERFVGWGHEDEDLRRRFVKRGYAIRSALTTAHVCHLWHRQVDSFHGKVKHGENVPYFKRGFFLSRCRMGLERRPLETVNIDWLGSGADTPPPPSPCEVAVGWGSKFDFANPRFRRAEIRIWYGDPEESGWSAASTGADLRIHSSVETTSEVIAGRGSESAQLGLALPELDLSRPDSQGRFLAGLDPIL